VGWLAGYQKSWLKGDLVAALTLWALVVPQAIAYAQIGGLPPEAGLFATFGGLLGYGLLGTSRQLVVSPTSATAAISAALVGPVAAGDPERFLALSAGLAALFGVVMFVFGLLSLGFVSRFISASVQTGLMFGLGLTIIAGQAPKLLGIPVADGDFFPKVEGLIGDLGDTHGWTAVIGLASLAAMFGLRRFLPAVPAELVVVVGSILAVAVFGLDNKGVEVIGDLDSRLPLLTFPSLSWERLRSPAAGDARDCADWLRGERGGCGVVGGQARLHGEAGPRDARTGRRQPARGAVSGLHRRGRRQSVGGERRRWRAYAALRPAGGGTHAADGGAAAATVSGPAAGGAGGDRDQRGLGLLERRGTAADRQAAAR
jgi:hypothetical protein